MKVDYRSAIHSVLEEAYAVARRVGEGSRGRVVGRGASGDMATELDIKVEEAIIRVIDNLVPGSMIVSEESGVVGKRDSKVLVLVDPVDGSTNASRGIPFCSSAVAVVEGRRFDEVVAAGVVDLVRGELIYGEKGGGVEVGGKAVTDALPETPRGRVCVGINAGITDSRYGPAYQRLLTGVRHPRTMGSAALETAYVALGRLDAYVEPIPRLRAFDCVPSLFIVAEAGGVIRPLNMELSQIDLAEPLRLSYVAARTPHLASWLANIVRG